jgi:hypothetical protein
MATVVLSLLPLLLETSTVMGFDRACTAIATLGEVRPMV